MASLKPLVLKPLSPGLRYLSQNKAAVQNTIPTWDHYFQLRKKKRVYEIFSSFAGAAASGLGASAYFLQLQIDPLSKILAMDPIMASGLGIVTAGVGGFLAGPLLGAGLFKVMNNKVVHDMDIRDKVFFEHIKNNRADARLNSIRNPVPDYYGEKIKSVRDYRSWLRKQREHYRKGAFGGKVEDLED
ncbi:mitochondrial import protein Pam17 [Sporodiniella umbellata]|nr:mitochondrial import protein Pam17 [Sporodiniella umbellata]